MILLGDRRSQQSDFDYINEDGDNGDYAF